MYTKKIYFAGGSFYELQEVFSRVHGVTDVVAGYINSTVPNPAHEDVLAGATGAAMGIEVSFDPKRMDLSGLMDILFTVVDPYVKDKQGNCEGPMYRSGVYYISAEDKPMVEYHMNFIQNRKKALAATGESITMNDPNHDPVGARKCYAEAMRLESFYPAADLHQNYLKHHAVPRTNIDFALLKDLAIIR
ncbi:MAG: peptide-methionine (S)-S-oxide reductase [Schwartzia sp. (in: firmicutes)]